MKSKLLIALCAVSFPAADALAQLEGLSGKMKEGLYEYRMTMEMPGMPPGMKMPPQTFQQCVTKKDMESGTFARKEKDAAKCEVKDFKTSGNTASYLTVCKDPEVKADTKIAFSGDGFKMNMKMAMNQGGQVMNMTQDMEARYLGPCKK